MKRTVEVIITVEVETDDSKFDKNFMDNFSRYFYEFDTIEEHAEHLAQLEARGMIDANFVEGYGALKDMGIKIRVMDREVCLIEEEE
ncbi:hypothetical protein HSX37_16275|uniref:Uncharacterized protein n=1 Tax=Dendrosporobacter quercicolus TaxID=146817 RepID=A0A1G9ZT39_9FIRM|nr:hypothetical protein [Dendrosporobacter quercicolus]NSL49593.1 hypothetical protein [Dendrosporobacter quercicolus DSM 1736]SDN24091.1 hypothetical protein SAMN04488502_11549 [Dendrosporobacter quercicolus]